MQVFLIFTQTINGDYMIKKINKRIIAFEFIMIFIFIILIYFLIDTMYFKRTYYIEKLNTLTNILVYGDSAPRGRIYDRNHNLLVDNEEVLVITYKNENEISPINQIKLAYQVIKYLDLDYNKLHIRNLKEYYLVMFKDECDTKITEEEYEKLKQRRLTLNDIENLKISRITQEELDKLSEEDKKAAYLYFLMNNGYSYSEKIIKENASYSEYAYFSENRIDGFNTKTSWKRIYKYNDTFKSILGNVGAIPKEEKEEYIKKGYSLNDKVGLSNIEKQYEDILKGKKAIYKKVSNNNLELISESSRGKDIVLSIDINLLEEINKIIDKNLIRAKNEANTNYFSKTYVVLEEPNTGEVLAITGRQILKNDNDYIINDITPYALTDPMTPGSVIKGASMLVGFNTGVIEPGWTTTDECIKLYNLPKKCSSHRVGKLNDIIALSESSNVYQFKIAMKVAGINYTYNTKANVSKAAFDTYRNLFKQFGLGVKTEIDLPVESLGYTSSTIAPDLLLNFSIGQYDTYTPIQLSQYITTIASNGNRYKPHLLKEIYDNEKLVQEIEPVILNKVTVKEEHLKRVQEGFAAVMDVGLGKNVMGNSPKPAGKTGTSESFIDTNGDGKIDTETVSNAFVGYAPRDNPKMTITVTSPDVEDPNTKINYHSYVNRRIAREISNKYFELLK